MNNIKKTLLIELENLCIDYKNYISRNDIDVHSWDLTGDQYVMIDYYIERIAMIVDYNYQDDFISVIKKYNVNY